MQVKPLELQGGATPGRGGLRNVRRMAGAADSAKPVITAAMVGRSHTLAEPRWSPSGERIAWLDAFDGRADLVVVPADTLAPALVVTADFPVAPAGAYGGGAFCWADDDHLVVSGADGRLGVVAATGGLVRILVDDGHAFAPAVSSRGEVACCIERADSCDVAVVPLDGSAWPVRISHADYAWDPAFSPDGALLAWHEWDLPNMPWDGSRIAVQDRASGKVTVVAGGDEIAVGQPRFSPAGDRLAFVSDQRGFMNLYVAALDGSDARPVLEEAHEHAEPSWGPGQRSYAWSPSGEELAWCRNEQAFATLVVGAPERRSARALARAWHQGIEWHERGIIAVRSGGVTPSHVVVHAADGSARRPIARGPAGGFERASLVEPKPVTWKSGGATVYGMLYQPVRPALGAGTAPPLLVNIHGGPTGQANVLWSARIQFFVERGWAVLTPDYRGSTGHGRAYAQALAGRWGERDVADVAAGIRHAGREGWCDPKRVAVMGGSAGGLTVLLLCAKHGDLLRAGVSLFGVVDLFDLAATTHRFESRYLDRIVGVLPQDAARYRENSPLTHAADISVPLLVLQGSEDKAVPPAQAQALVDAMRRAGRDVEFQLYEGEGHGWRRSATIVDDLTRSEAFLRKWVLER
jgi:dipeptidyl aminopeptidase/acylaminoacyl peptidase